jgi:hypothetical protein
VRKEVGARVDRSERWKNRFIKVCLLGVCYFHGLNFNNPIARVIIAVAQQDCIPGDGIELAGPFLSRLDDPDFASKRSKEGHVGYFLHKLLERRETAFAEGWEAVGSEGSRPNSFSPPLLCKARLNEHAPRHVDYGFVGAFRNAVVLRSVWRQDVVLDALSLEYVGEGVIAELPSPVGYQLLHGKAGLLLKEGLEVKDSFSGFRFPFEKGNTDEAGVLVDECDEVPSSRVGGGSDGTNQVSMNDLKWLMSGVKVAGVGNTGDFAFHAAVARSGLL